MSMSITRRTLGGPGGLPAGFEFKENSGKLELWKDGVKVSSQSKTGSWFNTAVSTGVGSIHLGGGESNTPAHSMSSLGQNVGFKNEAFNATPESAIVWFPPWQGLSADLSTERGPTYLKFGALQAAYAPNGIAQATGTAYDFTATMTANLCISAVTAQANEAYTGKITNIIRSSKGVDLHVSSTNVNVTAGQTFTINYPSLYFARNGDVLRLMMLKENGSPLQVRRGSMNSNPWRTLRARTFEDMMLAPLNGWTASRALVADSGGVLVNSDVTATELAVLSANVTPSNLALDDSDRMVVNDSGVMRQTYITRLYDYIKSKLPGTPYINKGGQSDWTREWASIQCQNGQWAAKSMYLGGMEFVWSSQASNTGTLLMRTISNPVAVAATQMFTSFGGSAPATNNLQAWPSTWQNTNIALPSAYQRIEMHMVTRAESTLGGCMWRIQVSSNGSSELNIVGEYYGPVVN